MAVEKNYLLSTLWTQEGKIISCGSNGNSENGIEYNAYVPLENGQRSATGCATTATSQILYYFLQNYSNVIHMDVLTDQDAYVSYANIPALTLYIPAAGSGENGTLSFDAINEKLQVFVPAPTDPEDEDYEVNSRAAADYIAALNFAVGVMLKSDYTAIWGTGSFYSDEIFLRSGFQSANFINFDKLDKKERSFWITENEQLTDEAIEIMIENVQNGSPVAFAIPGHAIVLDGYDSVLGFHLNYGWGPEDVESDSMTSDKKNTRWYSLEEFKQLGTAGFVIDISPVSRETFTVTDGRFFGSGTLQRVILQAEAMQGKNTIKFDENLAEGEALQLARELSLKDNILFSGFNMTLFAPDSREEKEEETQENVLRQGEEDSENNEDAAEKESVAVFFGEKGNRTEFTGFAGNVICRFPEMANGAAFYFSEAVQLTLSAGNAKIYAGGSSLEYEEILDNMTSGSLEELLNDNGKNVAVAGSDGDDTILFDKETLVIGDIKLADGHDTLTITGNSKLYGDIEMGEGDNKISISSGSSVYGNLLDEADIYMVLGEEAEEALFVIAGDAENTWKNMSTITIDAANAAADQYILFNQGDINELLEKLQIKGEGGIITADDGSIRWCAADGEVPDGEEESKPEEKEVATGETQMDVVVQAGEVLLFPDGSSASGSLTIEGDGQIKVMTGAKFIFDISAMTEENDRGIINDFSGINGTFHFAIKVAEDQACGSYILAENVSGWSFNTPIGVTAGNLTLGTMENGREDEGMEDSAFTYNDKYYALRYDEENKTLNLVIGSPFRTKINEDNSINLFWHKPVGAGGYFLEIARKEEEGAIQIFSEKNSVNILTVADGEYDWQVVAPGLETEYQEGGTFTVGNGQEDNEEEVSAQGLTDAGSAGATVYDAGEDDTIVDVFMAESSGIWGSAYKAQHVELPENFQLDSAVCTEVNLAGKNRYSDIFKGAEEDTSLLFLSDSENGDGLFLDDIYSAFPDEKQCERITDISRIYAGNGDDIIDLTSNKFKFSGEEVNVYGGDGNDVIWAGKGTSCCFYGDRGNDCLVGADKNDFFVGGGGDDVMHGGGGEDTFVYGSPETWGNDIIYQLDGDGQEAHVVELIFEQSDLEDKLVTESIDGGFRFSVAGYEDSSITFYGSCYTLSFGLDNEKLETIMDGGSCGEYASRNIFEKKDNGMLA
ncbi:MAG: C10 family peptidase [Lentisphaeria bacterium]|nr:C10 family peptidase [Lentisphaeria bacterium]